MDYIKMIRSHVGTRPLLLTACAIIIEDEQNRVLLQHRTDTNDWGIPGGFMELGESTEEAARREVYEETGLTVGELELYEVFSGKDFYFVYPNGDEVYNIIVTYTTKEVKGEIKFTDGESYDVKYFPLHQLPDKMIPTSRKMIEQYIKERE
ncbi:NUDIX hydrolase [Alkalihalobacillus sp. LMS39]|uniref:NUDIX hydrolase n=1 Tax=Alkalihalobacillus sp. LMS39 TaxID=2924032 RepID=UPI001FB3F94D|nr:NUDIX hydrolase [Alkalihalobacillus sp. LMS39]UOE93889.1 NUDIX hydrolase [Alkalihalobacillus sp. LMS39]